MIDFKNLTCFYQTRRFFITPFILVLISGFYLENKPLLDHFYALKEEEKIVSLQRTEKEQALQQASTLAERLKTMRAAPVRRPLLDQLIQGATQHHCQLLLLHTQLKNNTLSSVETRSDFIIQMRLRGTFLGFYGFIAQLLEQGLPLRLDQVSFKKAEEKVDIEVQFSAYPWASWLNTPPIFKPPPYCCRDPFQIALPDPETFLTQEPSLQQYFSQSELLYVGFFLMGNKKIAFVQLPNGRVEEIALGARLGRERSLVTAIRSEAVWGENLGRKIRLLSRR